MIKNYFKITLRNLGKNKIYLFLNTFGMGIALACCMSAYLLVAYDLEFDDYFKDDKTKNLVKVMHHVQDLNEDQYDQLVLPIIMAPIAKQEIAGIDQYMRYCSESSYMSDGERSFSENIYFADSSIFELFPFKLKNGSFKNFKSKQSIFISERIAKKYFGSSNPIGNTLTVQLANQPLEVFVGGVFDKIPLNSTFIPDVLMRIENYLTIHEVKPDNWAENRQVSVVFQLTPSVQKESISNQLNRYVSLIHEAQTESRTISFELIPFTEPVSPNDVKQSYFHLWIPGKALIIFMILSGAILLIACFNLTNTTLAMTVKRLKEIGVRKVLGSTRWQIIYQFLLEISITIILSILMGLLMSQIIVPKFAAMWGLQYGLADLNGTNLVAALIIILFISSILAGIYPAMFNSKQSPLLLFKGSLKVKGSTPFTNILLVTQFSLSVIALIAGVIFIKNANYQKEVSFGYDKENIIVVSINGKQDFERIRNAVLENSEITGVAAAHNYFGDFNSYRNPVSIQAEDFITNVYEIGPNYFDVMGLDLIDGRDFIENNLTDQETAAIVDINFVKRFGLKQPIGTKINSQGNLYRVVGVVKNHLNGLMDRRSSNEDHLYIMPPPDQYQVMLVRTNLDHILKTQHSIETQWKKIFPEKPFQSDLLQEVLFRGANEYNRNLRQIFLFLTILGCILSFTGIYSLASLNMQWRMKEIGVRRILGATILHVLLITNKQFAIILSFAMVFGCIGGYLITTALLRDLYTQYITISVGLVALCALFIFFIGISVTSTTILRATQVNPMDNLKYE